MDKEYIGITVSGNELTLVHLISKADEFKVKEDTTWKLQKGNRPKALNVMYQRIQNYIQQADISGVFIKASAAPRSGVRLSHLKSAEHRGLVMAAAASACKNVKPKTKAVMSRTFGERKTDDYVDDDSFWDSKISGNMRKGSRETALLILSSIQ